MTHVFLATEDVLSELVAATLVKEVGFKTTRNLRQGGFGYLKSNIAKFCNLARTCPVVLFADLDRKTCPPRLIEEWMGRNAAPPNLVIRVVVREIESWLLADHVAMRGLLGARAGALPRDPDTLADPKRALLGLAAGASRRVREELLADNGAVASQGIGYNALLGKLIRDDWNSDRAAQLSPSLAKARVRLRELASRAL